MTTPVDTDIDRLLERYEVILLDAYGVLLDKQGALPGASALIALLNREQRPYYLLTNSASHLPEIFSAELHAIGLPQRLDGKDTPVPTAAERNYRGQVGSSATWLWKMP